MCLSLGLVKKKTGLQHTCGTRPVDVREHKRRRKAERETRKLEQGKGEKNSIQSRGKVQISKISKDHLDFTFAMLLSV